MYIYDNEPSMAAVGAVSVGQDIPSPEATKQARKEAYAKYRSDCKGVRLLERLERRTRDPIEEHARLTEQLKNIPETDVRGRARARCELSRFWWERLKGRKIGISQIERQLDDIAKRIGSLQWRLERERWLYQRWLCARWPGNIRQPDAVKRGCEKKAREIEGLEKELSKLQQRRQQLEDQLFSD